jgi:hypothetical protein
MRDVAPSLNARRTPPAAFHHAGNPLMTGGGPSDPVADKGLGAMRQQQLRQAGRSPETTPRAQDGPAILA